MENPSSVEAVISDLLKEIFNQFGNGLTAVMQSFFTQLISCSTLHGALLELLEIICGKRGLLQKIFAWGLIVWIEAVILLIIILLVVFGLYSLNESVSSEPDEEITRF